MANKEPPRPNVEFIQKVKGYLDICKDLDAAREEMKTVNENKKELEMEILEFMETNDVEELEADGGIKIRLRTSKSTKPLNRDAILAVLSKTMKKEEAELLTAQIFDNRETTERTAISRVAPRGKRKREDDDA